MCRPALAAAYGVPFFGRCALGGGFHARDPPGFGAVQNREVSTVDDQACAEDD